MPAHGELKGRQVNPRELAKYCYAAGWHDTHNLMTAVCVCLAESQGYEKAFNENRTDDGRVISTDRGVFQINDKAHPGVRTPKHTTPKAAAVPATASGKTVAARSTRGPRSRYSMRSVVCRCPLTCRTRTSSGLPGVSATTSPNCSRTGRRSSATRANSHYHCSTTARTKH